MNTTTLAAVQSFRNLPRRRFSKEEKHQIVQELLRLNIPLARFARERDLHYNQLSRWRKDCNGPANTVLMSTRSGAHCV